jgi:hypothetical protein
VGEPVGPLLHFSIRASRAVADDVLPVAEVIRRVLEEIGEVELHDPRLEHVLTDRQTAEHGREVIEDRAAMDDFVSVISGTVSPADFFDPDNVGRIMSSASEAVAG